MAAALTGTPGRGRVYLVEPTGAFEDDPNVTNKRFRGNPTKSYRSKHPLRIVEEVQEWEEHPQSVITGMLDRLAELRRQGHDLIED
jgi:rifampin ADP-ribosylating transferase